MATSYNSALFHADDNYGRPLVGGMLYTYANTTTIPKPTYQDAAGTIANSNPIVLNARGEAIVFLTDGQVYTFVLTDGLGATIWTVDDVTGENTGGSGTSGLVSYVTPPVTDVGPIYWVGHGPAEWNGTRYASNYETGLTGGGYSFKNILHNGDFVSWSTGNTVFNMSPTNSGTETADFWYAFCSGNPRYTFNLNPTDGTTQFGVTGRSFAAINSTAAAVTTATDQVHVDGQIVGYDAAKLGFGSATAGNITVSFRVRASLPGAYCFALQNGARTRSYVVPYTVILSNTFEYKSFTIPIDNLVPANWAKTTADGLLICFDIGSGSNTETATPNTWQTGQYYRIAGSTRVTGFNGASMGLTEVQVQQGNSATPFEPYPVWVAQTKRYSTLSDMLALAAFNTIVSPGNLGQIFKGASNQALNATGYQVLPGGLILQWGGGVLGGKATAAVNFPLFHPTQCFVVITVPQDGNTGDTYRISPGVVTPGSFIVASSYVNAINFFWFSVGK